MKLNYVYEPFPHIIIEDVYTNEELENIWKELDFLCHPDHMRPTEETGTLGIDKITGMPNANSYGIFLDEAYESRDISFLLQYNRKMFTDEMLNAFAELSPLVHHVKYTNMDTTKLKYYQNNSFYHRHWDTARFTILTYFFREPKAFTGGNLYFEEYDYEVEIKNNMSVFFVGAVKHASLETIMNEPSDDFNSLGKFTMTQFLNIQY